MSSILETFFFLFESDASKLEKGLKEADKETDKLEANLKETDATAKMVGGSLLKMATGIGAAIGSVVAFATIKATIHETAMAIDDLADAAAALDLPVEDMHAYAMAATMMDGSQQGFISSLQTINIGLNSVATKGTGLMLPFLKELGLSMADVKRYAKDPLGALTAMSDAFSKLSAAEAAGLGAKIGLDQGTINLLAQGRRGIDELVAKQKEMGVVTKQQAEAAAKYDEQLKKNEATYSALKRELVIGVLPSVTWFLETIRKGVQWMQANKGAIVGFFGAAAAVLTAAYLPAVLAAARATWLLIAPFVAVGVAVAAFAAVLGLVLDDLWNYLQGNDSVIGELVKKWPMVGKVIDAIGGTLVSLIEVVRAFGKFFYDIITEGPQKAIENFAGSMDQLVSWISDNFPTVGLVFAHVGDTMRMQIDRIALAWGWLIDKIRAGIDFFKGVAGFIGDMHGSAARALGFNVAIDPTARALSRADDSLQAKREPARAAGASTVTAAARERPGERGAAPLRPFGTPDPARPSPGRATDDRAAAMRDPVRALGINFGPSPDTRAAVAAGQQQLAVTNSPIASQTSNSISNRNVSRTTTVEVGGVTVNTQATDAEGTARVVSASLGDQLKYAIDQHDDGVAA